MRYPKKYPFRKGKYGYGRFCDALIGKFIGLGLRYYKDFKQINSLSASFAYGVATPMFTASRSATNPATYIDENGVVKLVTTSNIPRFDSGYYDATGFHLTDSNNKRVKGLRIEAAGTNLFSSGVIDTNSSWDGGSPIDKLKYLTTDIWERRLTGSGASTNTISTDSKYMRSAKVSITNAGVATLDVRLVSVVSHSVISGTVYVTSFFVKTSSAITGLTLESLTTDGLTNRGLNATFNTIADTWIRISLSWTANATSAVVYRIGLGNKGLYDFYFDAFQAEASPYPTSFIPTTTAALTRNAETLKYEIAGNRNAAEETMIVKFVPSWNHADVNGSSKPLLDSSTKRRLLTKSSSLNEMAIWPNNTDSSLSVAAGTTDLVKNTSYVIGVVVKNSSPYAEIYINGISEGTETSDSWTAPAWGTYTFVGSSNSGVDFLNGAIQAVAIFNRALSATEVAVVTNLLNAL